MKEGFAHHMAQGCSTHVLQSPDVQGSRTGSYGEDELGSELQLAILGPHIHWEKALESAHKNDWKLLVQIL